MKYKHLIIEKKEYIILKKLMNLTGYYKDETLRKSVKKLVGELESAKVCDEAEMPSDVIRFNAWVTIVADNGWQKTFQLVMPTESDVSKDKISILTPMGAAVMGYAEGDMITWEFPAGEQKFTIEKVAQENKYIKANIVL